MHESVIIVITMKKTARLSLKSHWVSIQKKSARSCRKVCQHKKFHRQLHKWDLLLFNLRSGSLFVFDSRRFESELNQFNRFKGKLIKKRFKRSVCAVNNNLYNLFGQCKFRFLNSIESTRLTGWFWVLKKHHQYLSCLSAVDCVDHVWSALWFCFEIRLESNFSPKKSIW